MDDLFQKASRLKLRFDSPRGFLSVEDLWDLPLTSKNASANVPNLDDVAKSLDRELRATAEEKSFVEPTVTGRNVELQLGFDLVKHVIDVRVAERNAAADSAKKRETKQKLLSLIAEKQDEALRGKSLEDLEALVATM